MTTLDQFPVSGQVAAGFEPVRIAFEKNFATHAEVGAAVHVTVDGVEVVDLWGGAADAAGKRGNYESNYFEDRPIRPYYPGAQSFYFHPAPARRGGCQASDLHTTLDHRAEWGREEETVFCDLSETEAAIAMYSNLSERLKHAKIQTIQPEQA
jgi:hypothetical protein